MQTPVWMISMPGRIISFLFSNITLLIFLVAGTWVKCTIRYEATADELVRLERKVDHLSFVLALCCILPYCIACFLLTFDCTPGIYHKQWVLATILSLPSVVAYLEFVRVTDKLRVLESARQLDAIGVRCLLREANHPHFILKRESMVTWCQG